MIEPSRSWVQKALAALVLSACALIATGIIVYVANKPADDILAAQRASDEGLQRAQEKINAQAEVLGRVLPELEQTQAERDEANAMAESARNENEQAKLELERARREAQIIQDELPPPQAAQAIAIADPVAANATEPGPDELQFSGPHAIPGLPGRPVDENGRLAFFCTGNRTDQSVSFEVLTASGSRKHLVPARKFGSTMARVASLSRGYAEVRYNDGRSMQSFMPELRWLEGRPSRETCRSAAKYTFVQGSDGIIRMRAEP